VHQGPRRVAGGVLAAAAILALTAGAASAKTRTYSSGTLHAVVPGSDHARVFGIKVPDKGKIQNVRVNVRAVGEISNLYAYVISPTGQSVAIDEETATDGTTFGSGPNTCKGTPTGFDDNASTPIGDGISPYAGLFQPYQPLTPLNTRQMKGRWSLVFLNYNNGDQFTITLGCWQLKIKS
jgi:hypothetical protein